MVAKGCPFKVPLATLGHCFSYFFSACASNVGPQATRGCPSSENGTKIMKWYPKQRKMAMWNGIARKKVKCLCWQRQSTGGQGFRDSEQKNHDGGPSHRGASVCVDDGRVQEVRDSSALRLRAKGARPLVAAGVVGPAADPVGGFAWLFQETAGRQRKPYRL